MKNIFAILLFAFIWFYSVKSNAQYLYTEAGDLVSGYSGDGGLATSAELKGASGVAVDSKGNVYIADNGNNVIRKVNTSGIISTIAGNGTYGYSGDGGAAMSAELAGPSNIIVDGSGNIYFSEFGNNIVRKINTSGIISTVAGNGTKGSSGNGGPATSAELYWPQGIAIDGSGNLYIADYGNDVIREVNTSGIINNIAGDWSEGYSGDGGLATSAQLYLPTGVAVDNSGNVYIAEDINNVIRKVNTSGIISTIAGTGVGGYSGDGGLATSAELNAPWDICVDASGNLFIADGFNNVIRKINTSGIISTIAGNGTKGYSGDGVLAMSAELSDPFTVAVSTSGIVYFGEPDYNRIRKVTSLSGINTISDMTRLEIYPNPTNTEVTVNAELKSPGHVQMYLSNVLGQTVQTIDLGVVQGEMKKGIDLTGYSDGVYFIKFVKDGEGEILKVVKQ